MTWWKTVHPRSRGEHIKPRTTASRSVGSSPLARGTLRRHDGQAGFPRFIPARAGNTTAGFGAYRAITVHPRSRGEHPLDPQRPHHSTGSSPLARGTRFLEPHPHRRHRFIPARAGNTCHHAAPPRSPSVHPRSRGEHTESADLVRLALGSSPLARGTPAPDRGDLEAHRFIPARAGNTTRAAMYASAVTVHPRSRGEHVASRTGVGFPDGSSPLARGTRGRKRWSPGDWRFIPARAGNTKITRGGGRSDTVHPRSRGEHSMFRPVKRRTAGSSPLARGTRRFSGSESGPRRFIPARAGNTLHHRGTDAGWPVHPRSRGEHVLEGVRPRCESGSSPLARGTQDEVAGGRIDRRFIPARAGNTTARQTARRAVPVHPRSRGEHISRPPDL